MGVANCVRAWLNRLGVFNCFEPKVANVLFLGMDENCKKAVISSHSDEIQRTLGESNVTPSAVPSEYLTSWVYKFGKINFNFFDLGEHGIAQKVCRDYGAKMDAIVYIVNVDDIMDRGPREELFALLSAEAFANVPFLIFVVTSIGALSLSRVRLCDLLCVPDFPPEAHMVELAGVNGCPVGGLVAEAGGFLDGVRWLSRYI